MLIIGHNRYDSLARKSEILKDKLRHESKVINQMIDRR